ncbi:pilus assembly protein TadG-related protein [Pseudonocardia sp.]|uniref:pilus assembly protein TadG-related protein n=1 Tax=Pseudonocardia sp. TaxID=60912 RepID=UPI003D0C5694
MTPATRLRLLRRAHRADRADEGHVTAFVVVAVTGLVLVAGLVLDGGNALAARSRAIWIAEEAARAACQQIDLAGYRAGRPLVLDRDAADRAGRDYLASAGAGGSVRVDADAVTVTATVRVQPQLLDVLGIGAFEVTGTGAARTAPPNPSRSTR